MREIKFRAWDKEENRFWYFDLQSVLERQLSYMGSWDRKIAIGEKSQYVGLKDKHDKEIYEGDVIIVRGYSYEEPEFDYVGEVKYMNCGFCIKADEEYINLDDFEGSYTTTYEVAGNIYENPELVN